jgi:hypothetical protein
MGGLQKEAAEGLDRYLQAGQFDPVLQGSLLKGVRGMGRG